MIRGPIDGKYVELWGIPAWRRKLGIGDESETLTQRIESIIAGTANVGPDSGPGSVDNSNARLAAFATLEEAGYVVQTSTFPPAFAGRQIVGVPNRINVTNGTGINGNTVLQTPQDIDSGATPSFQTIKPTLLNNDFVTYVDSAGELASTTITATALATAVASASAMDILTTRGDLLSHDGTTYIRVGVGAVNTVARTDGLDVLWGQVVLTTDVTGILPTANGGTNKASWTAGSVIFAGAGGTALAEDNTGIFYDDAQDFLGLGVAVPLTKLHLFAAGATDVALLFQNANGFAALEYDGPTAKFKVTAISGPLQLYAGNGLHVEMDGAWNTYVINSGGTVTAFFSAAGNVGIGTNVTAPGALLDIGLAGTTLGVMRLAGSTSGNVTIQAQAIAGSWTLELPINDGTSGQALITNGSGVTSWGNVTAVYAFTEGSVIFAGAGGTSLGEDNANLFWNNATNQLGIGINTFAINERLHVYTADALTASNALALIENDATSSTAGINKVGLHAEAVGNWTGSGSVVYGIFSRADDGTGGSTRVNGIFGWAEGGAIEVVGVSALATVGLAGVSSSIGVLGTSSNSVAPARAIGGFFSATGGTLNYALIGGGGKIWNDSTDSIICANAALATNATDGFLYIPTCAGAPTGVPDAETGTAALVFDTTNDTLYIYRGGWKGVVVV